MAAHSSRKVIYAALIGNTLVAITKFIAATITGSSAMLSEGIHSVVDVGNQVLLLWGLKRAQRGPDQQFPFGHGKEIYFWSFIVSILIFAVGAGVSIYEGIHHVLHPEPIHNPTVNYIVLALAIVFEGFACYFAVKEFQKAKGDMGYFEAIHRGKDPSLFVVLFEDAAAMLGLVVAFICIFLGEITGNLYFDGGASIIIGLILAGTAAWLAYETKSLLIGESAEPETVEGIRSLVARNDHVLHVNELLTMHMGPEFILVTVSVEFDDSRAADDIEDAIHSIDSEIKSSYPEVKRIFIEAEARQPQIQEV